MLNPLQLLSHIRTPQPWPEGIQQTLAELKKCQNKETCLRRAYDILNDRFYGQPLATWKKPYLLFTQNLETIWNEKILLCTNFSRLLKFLLVQSGHFQPEEIHLNWTVVFWLSPHNYARVWLDNTRFVNVDIWGAKNGIAYGDYAHGFGKISLSNVARRFADFFISLFGG